MNLRIIRGGLVLAALLCVSSCGDKVDHDAPLAFVPADTPWLFANIEPVPEAVRSRYEQQMQAAWPVMLGMFDGALADIEKAAAGAGEEARDEDLATDESDANDAGDE